MLTRKATARALTYGLMVLWGLGFLVMWLFRLPPARFALLMGPLAILIGLTNLIFHNEEAELYGDRMQRHPWMQYLGPSTYSGKAFILPAIAFVVFGIFVLLSGFGHL